MDDIVERFAGKKVLVVGDYMVDRYIDGVVERISPEAPVPVLIEREEQLRVGGAGNVAANLIALGAQVCGVGVCGTDYFGAFLEKMMAGAGVALIPDPLRTTTVKTRIMSGNHPMLRTDKESSEPMSGGITESIIEGIADLARDVDGIFVSDYAKGVVSRAVAAALVRQSVPIMVDTKPQHADWFRGCSMMSPNLKEARLMAGMPTGDYATLANAIHVLFCTDTYLTLAGDGIQVCAGMTNNQVCHHQAPSVVDVSGCGDTAAATILLARLAGASPLDAARLANAAAGLAVGRMGAVPITAEQLKARVRQEVAA